MTTPTTRSSTTTEHERVLVPSSCGKARFGSTLAVDGAYLVVGASARDSTQGVASACMYDPTHGQLIASFANTRSGEYAGFADAIAVSARLGMVAVNAPGYEDGDGPVHLFERSNEWARADLIRDPYGEDETYWADGLAFIGGDLAIGSPLVAGDAPNTSGLVLLYDRGRGMPRVLHPSRSGNDEFGRRVAASDDLLLVSAPADDRFSGRVYVFEHAGANYTEIAQLVSTVRAPGSEFGEAIAIAGNLVFIGSSPADGTSGKVEVFERRGETFAHVTTLTSPDPRVGGGFGGAIACDGRRLAIGEPRDPGRRGRVWRFEIAGSTIRSLGAWQPHDLVDNEWFGHAVALGPGWLAAGAPSNTAPARFGRVIVRDWP